MPHYDLTRPVEDGMVTYPGDPAVVVEPHADFETDGYRVSALALGSHTGTHVDAPSHTEPDGRTLGDFPVETFRFDALKVDLRGRDPRAAVGPEAFPDPTDDDLLVLHTGWDAHWGSPRMLDHPYLTAEAAAWCVDHGFHVATDALSVDPTPSDRAEADEPAGVPAHHALLGDDALILENLTGLSALPERFELLAFPLALDADGAPVRAVGVV